MRDFVRRRSSLILFVIIITGGFLGLRRVEDINARTRTLAIQNRALALQIEDTVRQRRLEICAAETDTRTAIRILLLGLAADFPARRAEFELRINEALGHPPDGCS